MKAKIDQLQAECAEEDWDSYGARSIHPLSAALAHAVADAITAYDPNLTSDTLSPLADGGYEWEWDASNGTYYVNVVFLPDDRKELPWETC